MFHFNCLIYGLNGMHVNPRIYQNVINYLGFWNFPKIA